MFAQMTTMLALEFCDRRAAVAGLSLCLHPKCYDSIASHLPSQRDTCGPRANTFLELAGPPT